METEPPRRGLSFVMREDYLFEPEPELELSLDRDSGDSDCSPCEQDYDADSKFGSDDELSTLSSCASLVSRESSRTSNRSSSTCVDGGQARVVGVASLDPTNITAAANLRCGCSGASLSPSARVQCCMDLFNVGDIFRLRYAFGRLSPSEQQDARNRDIQEAFERNQTTCRIKVEGNRICLRAYCALYNINWSSMRRSWSRLGGGGHGRALGRPKGSTGLAGFSQKRSEAYAWLKTWVELSGDEDPVGHPYRFVVNYIVASELYKDFKQECEASSVYLSKGIVAERSFRRIWAHFCVQEKVRIRRKANTTTKCDGEHDNPLLA